MQTFVAICYGYWGRGATEEESLKQLRKAGAGKNDLTTVYCVTHEESQDKPFVDACGSINYHGTNQKIARYVKNKREEIAQV